MGKGKTPVLDAQGRKRCPKCDTYKALAEYTPSSRKSFGVEPWCRVCMTRYHYDNYDYDKSKDTQLKSMYGISLVDYNKMLTAQGGVCAICKQPETNPTGRSRRTVDRVPMLHVDHCHTTGAIRGLLCSPCNQALGLLAENPDRVLALLKYIEEKVLW